MIFEGLRITLTDSTRQNVALDQSRAPIYETLRSYIAGKTYPFHTPGHKGGRFAPPELVDLWGQPLFDYDLPAAGRPP